MYVSAHIGNIPVEEWVPFLVPVLLLYLYGRRRERRRRAALKRLPDVSELSDPGTVEFVMDRWSKASHTDLSPAYLPLLYPPGPDGFSASQLAERIHADRATVERLLGELEGRGYLRLEERDASDGPRPTLTWEGYELVFQTEDALLDSVERNHVSLSAAARQ